MRRTTALIALFAVVLLAGPASVGAENEDWWPADERPSYARLSPSALDDPRALLLRAAEMLTSQPESADGGRALLPESLRGAPTSAGGLVVVHFHPGVAARERLAILERHGATAGAAIPNNARVATAGRDAVSALLADPDVAWVGRLHPAHKLAPSLTEIDATNDLLVYPAPGHGLDALRSAAEAAGLAVVDDQATRLRTSAPSWPAVVELARSDAVLFVEPAFELEWVNDETRGICQSGTPGNDSIHARGLRGGGQVVAVMDSGLETSHCCFNGSGKVLDNAAWGGGDLGPDCGNDHGTHVAGTAVCENGGFRDGLAPDAQLILQDVGRSGDCRGVYPPNPLSSAWSDARSKGAFVHNNSWGGGFNGYGGDSIAIDDFMWQNQDFLIVFAAGNDGPGTGTLSFHSNAKNSLTVGGSGNGGSRNSMYGSSSRGPAGDGRLLPDLLAPATSVDSARSATSCSWVSFWGTSMAAPGAAGTAALVREYFEDGYHPSGSANAADAFTPTAAHVKAVMLASTRNMTGSGTNGARPNVHQGFGRLTADDALWFADEPSTEKLVLLDDRNSTTGFASAGQTESFDVVVEQSGSLELMLVWTDPPGSFLASKALVNDLDLEVQLEDGTTYLGNQGFSGGWTTTPGGSADRLNNKEAVFLQSVAPQTVTVRVTAHAIGDVALQDQDYALVAVGPIGGGCDEPPPEPPGDSVRHEKSTGELVATWDDEGAASYVAYRGTTPDFFTQDPAPYEEGITDEDPGRAGVQWTDTGALNDGVTYFYVYASANACGDVVP
jgi:hypothetical protein